MLAEQGWTGNYLSLVWAMILGFRVWGEVPTPGLPVSRSMIPQRFRLKLGGSTTAAMPGSGVSKPAKSGAILPWLSIHCFRFEIPQRGLVPRRIDLLVHPQYESSVASSNPWTSVALQESQRTFAVRFAFSVKAC